MQTCNGSTLLRYLHLAGLEAYSRHHVIRLGASSYPVSTSAHSVILQVHHRKPITLAFDSEVTMIPRPSILRSSYVVLAPVRASVLRRTLHRRFASTQPTKLEGPMDNAFNRERLAVKAHAAQSAGTHLA